MLTGRLKNELIGARLKVVTEFLVNDEPLIYDYVVYAVYPYCVSAFRIAESGVMVTRSFSIGDLVTMGIIKGGGIKNEEE